MTSTREHILQTSLGLFSQKGFKEVTMKDIVDNTGMSKGAFYHYFSSKEQVFEEVIQHFFGDYMQVDHSRFAQDSLQHFYNDILAHVEQRRLRMVKPPAGAARGSHFYYLVFDAMRLLPHFREQQQQLQQQELLTWKKVIARAKKSGEIRSALGDEPLAKLFIYLGDGTNLHLVLHNMVQQKKNELKQLWDGLYEALKP